MPICFSKKLKGFIEITRLDKPIGIYLLLWPTLWAFFLNPNSVFSYSNLFIFIIGVVVMRSAGCVINDIADIKVDGFVERTANRPLQTGLINKKFAKLIFFSLVIIAFLLVLNLNHFTIFLSFFALFFAIIYPFMKRWIHLPQLFLGIAFGWSIPMAYAAQNDFLDKSVWLLFVANIFYVIAYDTLYAMVDRDDDLKIGVKSTAILFGNWDKTIIFIMQIIMLTLLIFVGINLNFNFYYYFSLFLSLLFFVYQQTYIRISKRERFFRAFQQNHYVGVIILVGILLNYF